MEVAFVNVAGTWTRVYRAGDGPPILLVHGIGMTADVWLKNIDVLAKSYTVIAPDLLGCGFTGGMTSRGRPPLPDMIEHLFALLDELGVASCAFVGSSLGGWLATLCYLREPRRVSALVLVCCELVLVGSTEQIRTVARASYENGKAALDEPTFDATLRRLRRLVVNPDSVPESVALAQFIASALPTAREAFERRVGGLCALEEADELSVAHVLSHIEPPVLTIWGDSDVRGDPVLRDRASAALGGLTITMQGTGHLAQLEQPEEFNVAVHAFLGSVLGPGASTT